MGTKNHVRTKPENEGWYHDPVQREEIYRQIRELIGRQESDREIAKRLGINEQTVFRYRSKRSIPKQSVGGRHQDWCDCRGCQINRGERWSRAS